MTDDTTITIGLPFYNAEETLLDAVRSVLAQTFDRWILLLADDGSADRSLEIAKSIRDPRIQVISDGRNLQLSARLNQIAEMAKTPWLARMDADDLMHPRRLERQIGLLLEQRNLDLIGSYAFGIDKTNNLLGGMRRETNTHDSQKALERPPLIHPTVVGKTEWFRKNPYDGEFVRAEDRELWCRTFADIRFSVCEEYLYFKRADSEFNLNGYIKGCQTDRRIIRAYGPSMTSAFHSLSLVLSSYGKESVYRLFTPLGLVNCLLGKRFKALGGAESRDAETALKTVLSTEIPTTSGN